MKKVTLLTMAAVLAVTATGRAQEMAGDHEAHAAPQHLAIAPEEIQWGPAPPFLPAGAQAAVLEGDPTKEGPFTLRFQFPAGFKIAPHTHPAIEHVTVISGRFGIGLGESWDGEKIRFAGPGGFYMMMTGVAHFAMTTEDTIVQVHANGPWGLTYVNPADDPRSETAPGSND
jgi:quercetin dioxygenase-like cupin family protein